MRFFLIYYLIVCLLFFEKAESQTVYAGQNAEHIAFPIGGMGAGMFCLEGTGAISHFSIRNTPDIFNEPPFFAAIAIKGEEEKTRVLEGPVPEWKKFGQKDAALGQPGATWGLARFTQATFTSKFPFAEIKLRDKELPITVSITGWSPFVPTDQDNSSLPVGTLEYNFTNTGTTTKKFVFSFNMELFDGFKNVDSLGQGFILTDSGLQKPEERADLAVFTDDSATAIDHTWFRSGWFDPLTMAWNRLKKASVQSFGIAKDPRGASLMVPFALKPGQQKKITLFIGWYVPNSHLRFMRGAQNENDSSVRDQSVDFPSVYHKPWYSSRFPDIRSVTTYWRNNYTQLKKNTQLFTTAFYKSSLPKEVTEAVAANLTILKSPTMLRQYDGRFWGWEGCGDEEGSCPGSALPIRPLAHNFYAASDGQLGGIMKVYRDWRISGDSNWIATMYPKVKRSLDYCISTWDPRHTGTIEEPHHNTYDIEFWGGDGMITGIYLGALEAFIGISNYLDRDAQIYSALLEKGKAAIKTKLFNGKYFYQRTRWTGLSAPDPVEASKSSLAGQYSADAIDLLKKEGPKYQYGNGCLSDGVIGAWLANVSGLPASYDTSKISSHLRSVYKCNFKTNLSGHSNPQRPTYALGNEGGLLLCSWPADDKLSLPFPYGDEVWTGIEYEVASHLIFTGQVKEGLQIVKTARKRYDGRVRNPFDEYECGHWYARAMSSYALIQALTGVGYDAVTKTLYVDSGVGDFTSFLSTNTGFGDVIFKKGKVSVQVVYGSIDIKHILIK